MAGISKIGGGALMSALSSVLNSLIGFFVRSRAIFLVAESSRIKWWPLRSTRGGRVDIGRNCIINCRIAFDSPCGQVTIGDRCYVGASLMVCHTGITLGDDVVISWGVTIVDHDSHALGWEHRRNDVTDWAQGRKCWEHVAVSPVSIGNKVWIGFGVSVLKGVTIGEGAVIGANSVVTRDVPPFTLIAGNPARVVRQLTAEGIRQ